MKKMISIAMAALLFGSGAAQADDHLSPPGIVQVFACQLKDGRTIEMGNTGLMLNIITPLQKFSKDRSL